MAGMQGARRGQWAAAAKGMCCVVLGVEAWRAGWGQACCFECQAKQRSLGFIWHVLGNLSYVCTITEMPPTMF